MEEINRRGKLMTDTRLSLTNKAMAQTILKVQPAFGAIAAAGMHIIHNGSDEDRQAELAPIVDNLGQAHDLLMSSSERVAALAPDTVCPIGSQAISDALELHSAIYANGSLEMIETFSNESEAAALVALAGLVNEAQQDALALMKMKHTRPEDVIAAYSIGETHLRNFVSVSNLSRFVADLSVRANGSTTLFELRHQVKPTEALAA